MSTKCSVAWGDNFHFYTDCFDDDHVFLRLEGVEFDASRNAVTVEIPMAIWGVIQGYQVIQSDLIDLTDADITAKVEKAVDERIQKDAGKGGLRPMLGAGVYGSADDPRERQIGHGIAYFKQEQQKQIDLRDAIRAIRAGMKRPQVAVDE